MAKKVRGLNLQGIFDSRVLIVTHKDLDGIMSAVNCSLAMEHMGKDVVIYTDISPKTEKTDEIILDAYKGMDTLSMKGFDEVYILDRACCSQEMAIKLYREGVSKLVHIDHHVTNKGYSMEVLRYFKDIVGNDSFFNYIGNKEDEDYCAALLTFMNFAPHMLDTYRITDTEYNILRNYTILTDLYDTFKWTEFVNKSKLESDNIFNLRYSGVYEAEDCEVDLITSPYDVRPVDLNYIYKFIEDEDFYSEIMESIKADTDIQDSMKSVVKRFTKIEEETTKFIQYAYNDARKNDGSSKYDSAIFNMVVENKDGDTSLVEVLFIDKPLDYGASSVASYRFLVNNRNVILVFRSKEPSYSYSVRSIGDISTLDITTKLQGGGHLNASGFTLQRSKDLYDLACKETKKHVKEELLNIASDSIVLIER